MEQTFVNPRRIERARLAANMSHADLAYAIRRETSERLKPTEQSVRRWIKGKHKPSDGVIPAIAAATSQPLSFFYETDADDDEEESELLRDLEQLPLDLRRRVERALERRAATATAGDR